MLTTSAAYRPVPTGSDLLRALGCPTDDAEALRQADSAAENVVALLADATRGRGFTDGALLMCTPGLYAVAVSAGCRWLTNPSQAKRLEAGELVSTPTPFTGWTLAEQLTIRRHRVRILT